MKSKTILLFTLFIVIQSNNCFLTLLLKGLSETRKFLFPTQAEKLKVD